PEGCASITWRDANLKARAAAALKPTAQDLLRLGLIDEVVPEPGGGAHLDAAAAAQLLGDALARHLDQLTSLSADALRKDRYQHFRRMGEVG
ncbi:MAG TPA: acetyl-CoA carboxylase carboxyl transferase subunit alpha, partial [Terriglobales bacterium]